MFEIEVVRFDAQDVIATSACTKTTVRHIFFENSKGTVYTYTDGAWKKEAYTMNAPIENVNGWYELGIGSSWIVTNGELKGACNGIEIAQ